MWNHSAHTLHWIVSSECPVRLAALCPGLHCSVHIIHMKSSDAKEHVQFSTFEKSTKNCKTLFYSYFLLWACMIDACHISVQKHFVYKSLTCFSNYFP